MGRGKNHKIEFINAFSRMNYLHQASVLASKAVPDSVLSHYYGRLMKEVSKKVVEKIHPRLKRKLCSYCSYPSFTGNEYGSSKIKPYKKKKSKKMKKIPKICRYVKKPREFQIQNNVKKEYYKDSQIAKKNIKPNKLLWSCKKCGYFRTFLQRPYYYLWIEKFEENQENKTSSRGNDAD